MSNAEADLEKSPLMMAANELRRFANELREAHTNPDGSWPASETETRAEFDRLNHLAGMLEPELAMARTTADDYWRLVQELRDGLQEIYTLRGEDEVIARIASPLIDRARP